MLTDTVNFPVNRWARIGGASYLIIIILGLIGEMFVRGKLVVYGDPAQTARNIMDNQLLWRSGIAGDLTMHVCDAVISIVYYVLFRKVNKRIALLALFFGLIQTAVLVANKITLVLPLLLLNDPARYMMDPVQAQGLAYLSVALHGYGFGIGLIFFGFDCLLNGWLIIESKLFPRVLGILVQVAGVCYLLNSFALILYPAFADALFPAVMLPPLVAELSIALWLVVKGVNINAWNKINEKC